MFRVLSDEEASRVTRWQAPDIPVASNSAQYVRADSQGLPAGTLSNSEQNPLIPQLPEAEAETVNLALSRQSVDMVQAGYDDGYAQGYAQGYAEGNAALHQQSVKQLNSIVSAISQSASCIDDSELETQLVALSSDIARLIIRRELTLDPELILEIVRAGMQQLPELNSDLRHIHLHPLDAAIVRDLLEDNDNLAIVNDPSADRADCRIESGASVVRSGVDDWLAAACAQLGIQEACNKPDDDGNAL